MDDTARRIASRAPIQFTPVGVRNLHRFKNSREAFLQAFRKVLEDRPLTGLAFFLRGNAAGHTGVR
jgi:hypothetical protein